jgi:hypothetical protein
VAAALLLAATAALIGGVAAGLVFAVRAVLTPAGPGPRALPPFDAVQSLAVSDNGDRAAAAGTLGREASIRAWDARAGRPTLAREFRPGHPLTWFGGKEVGLSPDGGVLAALTYEVQPRRWWLTFWRVESGDLMAETRLAGPALGALTFTADGSAVVFSSGEGIVTVRAPDGKTSVVRPADKPGSGAVYVPAIRRVLQVRRSLGKGECELAAWDPAAEGPPDVVRLAWSDANFAGFAVSRDGRTVVLLNAARDRTPGQTDVTAYDRVSGQRAGWARVEDAGGTSSLNEIALSADGALLAIEDAGRGGLTRSVDVYRVADGGRVAQSLGETHPEGGRYAFRTVMVPDGSALYFVRRSSTIVRFDLRTGQETED